MKKANSKKNILITGGAGFIGLYLAEKLSKEKGTKVTILDNFQRQTYDIESLHNVLKDLGYTDMKIKAALSKVDFSSDIKKLLKHKNVKLIKADMSEKSFTKKLDKRYDEIYHLAIINGTRYFYEKPLELMRNNILSTIYLLDWITPKNTGKFLFTGSSESYSGILKAVDNPEKYLPTDEQVPLTIFDPLNPRNSYGGAKLANELLTINYLNTKKVPFTIARYHNIYGGRMGFAHVVPDFIKRIAFKENPFNIYGAVETREFCYVDDAVDQTIGLMRSKKADSEIVHIGYGNYEVSMLELAKLIHKLADVNPEIKIFDAPKGSPKRRIPNTKKVRSITSLVPKYPLSDGLKITLDWYLNFYNDLMQKLK